MTRRRRLLVRVIGLDASTRYGTARTFGRSRLEALVYSWVYRSTPLDVGGRARQPDVTDERHVWSDEHREIARNLANVADRVAERTRTITGTTAAQAQENLELAARAGVRAADANRRLRASAAAAGRRARRPPPRPGGNIGG